MQCRDTNSALPAVHCPHVDTEDISTIDGLIAFFLEKCNGNGIISLIVNNGRIQRYDPTSRIEKRKRRVEKKAG